jgi:hypothetical protein
MIPARSFQAPFRNGRTGAGLLSLFLAFLGNAALADKTPPPPAPPLPANQPGYFFTLDLDPRYQYVGTGALTEEDAAHANCYRLVYDADGKLRQIEYLRAGIPTPDRLFGVTRIDVEYQPGIERRWFRDAQGQPVRDVDGNQGEELALNAAGYPTEITNLDAPDNPVRDSSGVIHYLRTLDDHNRLVTGRRLGLLGTAITDDGGFFETRTVYDTEGRVMERSNHDGAGNLLNNSDGVALIRTTYTIYPDAMQIVDSYFDASSLATEEKSSGVHQRQRVVDQRGLLLDESYFDAGGAPTTDPEAAHERRYTYDARGNELTEQFFGIDGKPVDRRPISPRGLDFAAAVYKYDDKNRVVALAYFGEDGAAQIPRNLGAAVVRQEYDAKGDIVRRQFFDGLGHPSANVQYGAPAIRIGVDGDTTIVTLRNAKDQPMKNPINGYYAFSYKTTADRPLSPTNLYFDRHGRRLSYFPRVSVINPHLHALKTAPVMEWSARLGAGAAGIGALLGCVLALRKSYHTKRRRVYVPSPLSRFLGWLAVFCILEGSLRFFMTIYWAWVGYQNGRMGNGVYLLEAVFIVFFLYRLYRLRITMRVLNIGLDDIHRVVRDFFTKSNLKPEWIEAQKRYVTPPLDIRIRFFRQKCHAYLAFRSRGVEGSGLERAAAEFIRAQAGGIEAPPRTRAIALYYPSVALCYLLLAGTAFYTLWQLIKGF